MPGFGVGLRHQHFPYLLQRPQTRVDWFEVISENFLDSRGYPFETLMTIRSDYPIALHGVSMSLGGPSDPDIDYLKKLRTLIELVEPFQVSDHLCWTGSKANNLHNLLPLPYTEETLKLLESRVDKVQSYLRRPIAIENLSTYFEFKESTYSEWDFLTTLVHRTGAKILLDINNVYVSATNHGYSPFEFLEGIPPHHIAQVHLAGFTDMGGYLLDTHSKPVYPEVWELYKSKLNDLETIPVLVEWDEDIPDFQTLEAEATKARQLAEAVHVKV
jgi:uncharacterized protein (UPF0276 family)